MPGSYVDSTQSNHWLFSEQDLAERRGRRTRSPPSSMAPSPGATSAYCMFDVTQSHATQSLLPAAVFSESLWCQHLSYWRVRAVDMAVSPYPTGTADLPTGTSSMLISPAPGGESAATVADDMVHEHGLAARADGGVPGQLSADEDTKLRLHYEMRLQEVCEDMYKAKRMQRPSTEENIASTAITYFKRFYLQQSMSEHHPAPIMLASLYTATKIEEVWFGAMLDEILKVADRERRLLPPGKDPKTTVVEHEMTLLSVLQFHLIIFHPYRPLRSFISQYQEWAGINDAQAEAVDVGTLHRMSTRKISAGFVCDLPLLYTPAQIALAALSLVSDEALDPERKISPTWGAMQADVQRYNWPEALASFIAQELLTGDMAAVDGCRRKIDDIRAKLKAAESKHRKYKRACGDQRVSQPPEWVDALEARLTPSVGTASAIVHSGHKRSTADKNTGVDVDKLQQLQRPFKSPKVE